MSKAWIKEALAQKNIKQVELARFLGVSESVMSKMINTSRKLGETEAAKIRAFIEGDVQKPPSGYAPAHGTATVHRAEPHVTVPLHTEMADDIPVLGTALGGSAGGDFTLNGDSGLRVRRPPRLAGRVDVFGLFVQGDSMAPRYMPGELIFCETKRPPQIGDHVVVEMMPDASGVSAAYLKRLVKRGTRLVLEQYNPSRQIELEAAKVKQVIRVMTTHDLLGI